MDNTQTNQDAIDEQDLDNQVNNLLEEAKKINQELEESSAETKKKLDEIELSVDESITKIEAIHADLDQAEKEAGDELDKLILQQVDVLTKEDALEE